MVHRSLLIANLPVKSAAAVESAAETTSKMAGRVAGRLFIRSQRLAVSLRPARSFGHLRQPAENFPAPHRL